MKFWTIVWTVWGVNLALSALTFLIMETIALAGAGSTLSEHVWGLRNLNDPLYWIILDAVYVMAVVMVWLIWHFRFQGPR